VARSAIERDAHDDPLPAVEFERADRIAIAERADRGAHAALGVVLHRAHRRGDTLDAMPCNGALQLFHPAAVRRQLGAQVRQILRWIAGGPRTGGECRQHVLLEKAPLAQYQSATEHGAFLGERGRERRHGSRRDTADISVVGAARDEERRPPATHEQRTHERHVGQVRAAVRRRIGKPCITVAHGVAVLAQQRDHRRAHGAEMHRHMWRIGDQPAVRVEDRAGIVESFLDVHRLRRTPQHFAHLTGSVHEQTIKDFNLRRIIHWLRQRHGLRCHRQRGRRRCFGGRRDPGTRGVGGERPARLEHESGMRLDE
jgi:hypothetical protein